jgi:curved DNA-binding protein CbpA
MMSGQTLYDVLGVSPDASAEELRRAFRDRASVLHPDRHVQSSQASQALAEHRMRELTAAWQVLSDAGRRRRYDRELALGSEAVEPDAERYASRLDGTMDEVFEPIDGTARIVRAIPWVALAAVLAAIFVFSAYALTGGPRDDLSGTGTRIGQCVLIGSDDSITRSGCDAGGAREIVMLVGPSNPCPAGTERRQPPTGSAVYCLRTTP